SAAAVFEDDGSPPGHVVPPAVQGVGVASAVNHCRSFGSIASPHARQTPRSTMACSHSRQKCSGEASDGSGGSACGGTLTSSGCGLIQIVSQPSCTVRPGQGQADHCPVVES